MQPLDTIVFETPLVRAARFRCSARDPRFRDSGPTENFLVVFPRTAVWVRHSGSRAFVADPSLATIYNPGQEYTREAISSDGDRCEWFGVAPNLAMEIASSLDPRASDRCDKPFVAQHAPVDRRLYFAQRTLFTRLERGEMDSLEAEEAIIKVVTDVIARSIGRSPEDSARDTEARVDLIQRAKASLSKTLYDRHGLNDLAAELDVSPFHLCRVFRGGTGLSLHAYKTDLRLRSALERIGDSSGDLSRTAFELGFSSHSHFTSAVRAKFGSTPSALRKLLAS